MGSRNHGIEDVPLDASWFADVEQRVTGTSETAENGYFDPPSAKIFFACGALRGFSRT